MDDRGLDELLDAQAGVVSRRQLLGLGFDADFIRRRLRRKDWVRVHNGIYDNHTGPLAFLQRAWAALLFYAPPRSATSPRSRPSVCAPART